MAESGGALHSHGSERHHRRRYAQRPEPASGFESMEANQLRRSPDSGLSILNI